MKLWPTHQEMRNYISWPKGQISSHILIRYKSIWAENLNDLATSYIQYSIRDVIVLSRLYLSERVLSCHELSWNVTKCHHVKWNIFWWSKNIMKHHRSSLFESPNVIKCHHVKWSTVTFSDSWWCLMIFKYFSWQNYVFYHDILWHIINYHDFSRSIWER